MKFEQELTLKKDTIQALSEHQIEAVAGGVFSDGKGLAWSCRIDCPEPAR